jgi:hypothetical protein
MLTINRRIDAFTAVGLTDRFTGTRVTHKPRGRDIIRVAKNHPMRL